MTDVTQIELNVRNVTWLFGIPDNSAQFDESVYRGGMCARGITKTQYFERCSFSRNEPERDGLRLTHVDPSDAWLFPQYSLQRKSLCKLHERGADIHLGATVADVVTQLNKGLSNGGCVGFTGHFDKSLRAFECSDGFLRIEDLQGKISRNLSGIFFADTCELSDHGRARLKEILGYQVKIASYHKPLTLSGMLVYVIFFLDAMIDRPGTIGQLHARAEAQLRRLEMANA